MPVSLNDRNYFNRIIIDQNLYYKMFQKQLKQALLNQPPNIIVNQSTLQHWQQQTNHIKDQLQGFFDYCEANLDLKYRNECHIHCQSQIRSLENYTFDIFQNWPNYHAKTKHQFNQYQNWDHVEFDQHEHGIQDLELYIFTAKQCNQAFIKFANLTNLIQQTKGTI